MPSPPAIANNGLSPTLITDSVEALGEKIARLAGYCRQSVASDDCVRAAGIHLEGPFLSEKPGFIGAHPARYARDAELDLLKRWVELSQGTLRMVTLAPERDPNGNCIRWLTDQGILVAAGHTDATLDQLQRAIDCGLSIFTHLGNACPMLLHRHDNIVHRALSLRSELRFTLIADGQHLPFWLLHDWVRMIGDDRVAIVSDAISAACLPPGTHLLGERVVNVGRDGVPRSEDGSHFVGSGMTLQMMDQHLAEQLPLPDETRRRIFRINATDWLQ
jgi:N-acetylglucosamine-6-phosphate deacetylase